MKRLPAHCGQPPAKGGAPGKEPRPDVAYQPDPPRQELLPKEMDAVTTVTPAGQPNPSNGDNAWWVAVISAVQPAIYGERWTPWIRLVITAGFLLGIWLLLA